MLSLLQLGSVLFAVATLTTSMVSAATLWNWEYSTSGITATGTLITGDSPEANDDYLITGITGTRNGSSIRGLQAPGTLIPGNGPYLVDDLIVLGSGPPLTSNGLGFYSS